MTERTSTCAEGARGAAGAHGLDPLRAERGGPVPPSVRGVREPCGCACWYPGEVVDLLVRRDGVDWGPLTSAPKRRRRAISVRRYCLGRSTRRCGAAVTRRFRPRSTLSACRTPWARRSELLDVAKDDRFALTEQRDEAELASVLRSMGVESGWTPRPLLVSTLKELEEDEKRRANRGLRDSVYRVLVDLLLVYLYVLVRQLEWWLLPACEPAAWADWVDRAGRRDPTTATLVVLETATGVVRRCSVGERDPVAHARGASRGHWVLVKIGGHETRAGLARRARGSSRCCSGAGWNWASAADGHVECCSGHGRRGAASSLMMRSGLSGRNGGSGLRRTTVLCCLSGRNLCPRRIRLAAPRSILHPGTGSARCSWAAGGPGVLGVDSLLEQRLPVLQRVAPRYYDIVAWESTRARSLDACRGKCDDMKQLDASLFYDPDLPDGERRARPAREGLFDAVFGAACLGRTGELLADVDTREAARRTWTCCGATLAR